MFHPSYSQIAHAIRRREAWTDDEPLYFPEEGADLFFLKVASRHGHHLLGYPGYSCEEHGVEFGAEVSDDAPADVEIEENLHFRYPFLRDAAPAGDRRDHLVLIFHGLNERSFTKYVPWAYQLWRSTGAAVALYPLSFHIRRVSPRWARTCAPSSRPARLWPATRTPTPSTR